MPSYNISSGLPDLPVGLDDKDAGLVGPLYRAISAIAQQLSLLTGNVQYSQTEQAQADQLSGLIDLREQRVSLLATEPLSYGSLITMGLAGGKITASLADATNLALPAHGICDTVGGIASGQYGICVLRQGRVSGVAGTVFGATYYLSTAGTMQITPPTADGVINQIVATGLGSAGIYLGIETLGRRVSRAYKPSAAVLRIQYTDGTFTDQAV